MAHNTRLLVLALVLLCAGVCASASQTITMSLDTPCLDASSNASASAADHAKSSSANAQPNTVKVGRVGTVQVSTASIFQSKSYSSRKYAVVKSGTPLAIVKEENNWYGVLMINGAIGWIGRSNVKMTDYQLVSKEPAPRSDQPVSRGVPTVRDGAFGVTIVRTALSYTGTISYVFGGSDPATGMDCSAFLRMVFGQNGVTLPRTAREQAQVGDNVPFDQLQPGDRLYFSCKNPYIDHCGIYAGGGSFVHCSSSRHGVEVDSLSSSFYWRSLVAARRS